MKPSKLQFIGSQRVGHDLVTENNKFDLTTSSGYQLFKKLPQHSVTENNTKLNTFTDSDSDGQEFIRSTLGTTCSYSMIPGQKTGIT